MGGGEGRGGEAGTPAVWTGTPGHVMSDGGRTRPSVLRPSPRPAVGTPEVRRGEGGRPERFPATARPAGEWRRYSAARPGRSYLGDASRLDRAGPLGMATAIRRRRSLPSVRRIGRADAKRHGQGSMHPPAYSPSFPAVGFWRRTAGGPGREPSGAVWPRPLHGRYSVWYLSRPGAPPIGVNSTAQAATFLPSRYSASRLPESGGGVASGRSPRCGVVESGDGVTSRGWAL